MKLIREKKLFLLDMDGTIYHENTLIPGANEFLKTLKYQGKDYVFMTNNSSKNKNAYIEKLRYLGIEANRINVSTSIDSTIAYIKNYKLESKIYLVGTQSFKEELVNEGFSVVEPSYIADDVDIVLVGYDTELTYEKLEKACYHLSRGKKFIATNIDLRCPVKDNKFIPDCGAICNMITTAVGVEPIFLGKPEKEMILAISEQHQVPLDEMMCIGDRLYTDIACGINAGVTTGLVFTGETKPEDILTSQFIPDFQFESIADLYQIIK